MKSQSVFSEFFYDILSYVIPGGLVVITFSNYFELLTTGQTTHLKLISLYSSQIFKDYTFFSWIVIIVFSYVIGMFMFDFTSFLTRKLKRRLSYDDLFAEVLKKEAHYTLEQPETPPLKGVKEQIIREIVGYFDLEPNIHNWNEYIAANRTALINLVRNYIHERSVYGTAHERLRDRLALIRSFSFSLFFISLNSLWILRGEHLFVRCGLILFSLLIVILSTSYYRMQSLNYVEHLLLQFYVLRKLETSESRVVKENSLLQERLDQVERDIKKQRSSADVISQLAHHFMPQSPTKDKK